MYIASPFFDMREERRYLAAVIVPQLQTRCEERGISFEMIDLRSGATGERDAAARVLAGFIYQIDHCRPYFIGLLGDRSGEAPIAVHEDVLAKQQWLREELVSGKSVVALEFLHGALRNPRSASHAFFYFRDAAYSQSLPESERLGSAGPDEALRVSRLKESVRESGLCVHENFSSPEALGELVLADLSRAIDSYISEAPKTTQLSMAQLQQLLAASCGNSPDSSEPDPSSDSFQESGVASGKSAVSSPGTASQLSGRRVRITHLSGSRSQTVQEFDIDAQNEVWVGRHPVSHVLYSETDRSVSRAHMKIVTSLGAPNAYILVSRGRNGAFINNTEVLGSSGLTDGDIVQVGRGGPIFRFQQFPKPEPLPGEQAEDSEDPQFTPPTASETIEPPKLISGVTSELKYDPVLAWAMLQKKADARVSEGQGEPQAVPVVNKESPVLQQIDPKSESTSPSFRMLVAVLVVVALGLIAAWLMWKR